MSLKVVVNGQEVFGWRRACALVVAAVVFGVVWAMMFGPVLLLIWLLAR